MAAHLFRLRSEKNNMPALVSPISAEVTAFDSIASMFSAAPGIIFAVFTIETLQIP
jgi:phosphoribosylcarboxyaminoimidazole (NCAIR) mutase